MSVTGLGGYPGVFAKDPEAFRNSLRKVKALVFDWDGVFNKGEKTQAGHSGFSEPDSMGVNLLRFAFWLRDGETLPVAAIISGARNEMAELYARREHFHSVVTGIKQKDLALKALCTTYHIEPEEIAFFFDDIIDLGAAKLAGVRIFFAHPSAMATRKWVVANGLFDYMPGHQAGEGALRETCEMMLTEMGLFDQVVQYRMAFSGAYERYLQLRDSVATVM
ncbi:MAG TPA: hypothetical protein P5228_00755 [Bacteroidales bacterium]|nr:hypothetical protein [Bacteroidales bacterium]HRZ48007.1 hypothetical protein [Bacteroidales bacterium]